MLAALATSALAQGWSTAYEAGLKAGRASSWSEARSSFQMAAASRTEDYSGPTALPGPPSERRQWRNGSPYSPNFLAAYAGYRHALTIKDSQDKANELKVVSSELEALIAKNQVSKESVYFLQEVYAQVNDQAKIKALQDKVAKVTKFDWKVDTEIVSPDELAAINSANQGSGVAVTQPGLGNNKSELPNIVSIKAGDVKFSGETLGSLISVPALDTKYALIIGQPASKLSDLSIASAAEDAQAVRNALINYAGYPDHNVDLVVNATASQILAAAKALADRVPEDATVLIYYAGPGVNLGGRDYLAGVDTELASDATTMAAKADVYKPFVDKGAKIFAFFESNRPVAQGRYFGQEMPQTGRISQMQATIVEGTIETTIKAGKSVSLFADSFASALQDLRSNRLPIMEFGWQLFYKMRQGATGTQGGGARQPCTLPVPINMAADARF